MTEKINDMISKALNEQLDGLSVTKKSVSGINATDKKSNPLTMGLKKLSEIPMSRLLKGDYK